MFLKAGGKLKYLAGYTAAYMHTNNFSYNLQDSDYSQELTGDFSYGYSKSIEDYQNNDDIDDNGVADVFEQGLFGIGPKVSSHGFGADIGVVYEYRPDYMKYKYDMDGETNLWYRDKDKYKFRVGASIIDLGGMRFTKGGLSRDFSVNSNNLFDLNTFDNANSLLEFDQIIDSLITSSADTDPSVSTFITNLS